MLLSLLSIASFRVGEDGVDLEVIRLLMGSSTSIGQQIHLPSALPLAIIDPSGLNATDKTRLSCPSSVVLIIPSSSSHTRTTASLDPGYDILAIRREGKRVDGAVCPGEDDIS